MAQSDQLRVPEPARTDAKSFELLRVWVAEQGQHVSLRSGAWEDPFAWGIVLADLARHSTSQSSQTGRQPGQPGAATRR